MFVKGRAFCERETGEMAKLVDNRATRFVWVVDSRSR